MGAGVSIGGEAMDFGACIFCDHSSLEVVGENEHALAVRDRFPVRPLHTLIIPKRHVENVFATDATEREAIHALALVCADALKRDDPTISGFNFGSNIGVAAGQKIMHAHIHLIPRRFGDLPPPAAKPESIGSSAHDRE
jgi:diadenosine tetraphosphate (Ap4A) HIT family hydrolase